MYKTYELESYANTSIVSILFWWVYNGTILFNWNIDWKIQTGLISVCGRIPFGEISAHRSVATKIDWGWLVIISSGFLTIDFKSLWWCKPRMPYILSVNKVVCYDETSHDYVPCIYFSVVTPQHAECLIRFQEFRFKCFLDWDNLTYPSNSKILVYESNLSLSSVRKIIQLYTNQHPTSLFIHILLEPQETGAQ